MSDRNALAAALQRTGYAPGDAALPLSDFALILAAARERLAQLPEKCETCGGTGTVTNPSASEREYLEGLREDQCPHCRLGFLYPSALVERIANLKELDDDWDRALRQVVAVLDALNAETP